MEDVAQAKLDAMQLGGLKVSYEYEESRHWSIVVMPGVSYADKMFTECWFDGDTLEDCIDQAFDYYLGILDYVKTN